MKAQNKGYIYVRINKKTKEKYFVSRIRHHVMWEYAWVPYESIHKAALFMNYDVWRACLLDCEFDIEPDEYDYDFVRATDDNYIKIDFISVKEW